MVEFWVKTRENLWTSRNFSQHGFKASGLESWCNSGSKLGPYLVARARHGPTPNPYFLVFFDNPRFKLFSCWPKCWLNAEKKCKNRVLKVFFHFKNPNKVSFFRFFYDNPRFRSFFVDLSVDQNVEENAFSVSFSFQKNQKTVFLFRFVFSITLGSGRFLLTQVLPKMLRNGRFEAIFISKILKNKRFFWIFCKNPTFSSFRFLLT